MTKIEKKVLHDLMIDAIISAKQSKTDFQQMEKCFNDKINRSEFLINGKRHLGYAEGIYRVLSEVGYTHKKMKELEALI